MKKLRIAINGFGRIGRAFFKMTWGRDDLEVVAINDLSDLDNLAYLLKYDTAYGVWDHEVRHEGEHLVVDGRNVKFVGEVDPSKLPWGELNVDVVVESTGVFTDYAKASAHLKAGAKRIVISAPAKGEAPPGVEAATVLMGVNEERLATCRITSNGSCTTNASSPIIQIMSETIGVEKAMLNTVHGYTASQRIVDGNDKKDFRRGRAGAMNIIPTTTGAARSVAEAIKSVEGKFDGIAMRVPVIAGSVADITFISNRDTTAGEVNDILTKAAEDERWRGIMKVTSDQIVSSDIVGERYGAIIDLPMTRVVDGNLVKILAWYDNEMGYTNTLALHVVRLGKFIVNS